MRVVFYDRNTGKILSFVESHENSIITDRRPYIEVDERRDDYDVTHKVVDGKLVEI